MVAVDLLYNGSNQDEVLVPVLVSPILQANRATEKQLPTGIGLSTPPLAAGKQSTKHRKLMTTNLHKDDEDCQHGIASG